MNKVLFSVLAGMFLSGCGTTSVHEVKSKQELKYKKILVMPFTKSGEANVGVSRDTFISELSLFPDIQIIGQGQMDETTIKNLGVTHPESFGAMDFSASPEGDDRRKKIVDRFPADAVIFGYSYTEEGLLSLHIQMMDAASGTLILGFFKDASIPEATTADDAARDLARKSAHKTIDFLKDNVVITRFHRR
jgi:hypothetical protein